MNNATVTMDLSDFDALRRDGEFYRTRYRNIASGIAKCFEYKREYTAEHPKPNCNEECSTCGHCSASTEILVVNVNQLIDATKEYACWGYEMEVDLDKIKIEHIL